MPKKLILIFFSFSIFTGLFFWLAPVVGDKSTALSLIPITVVSLIFGIRTGLISAFLIIPINIFYLYIFGLSEKIVSNIPGAIGSFFIAAAIGYMSDQFRNSKEQLKLLEIEKAERKKAEEKLFEIQSRFKSDLSGTVKEINSSADILKIENVTIPQNIYREIAENATDIIYTINIEGYFTYSNKMGLQSCGYTEKELYKLKYIDLIVPEFREKVKRFYLKQYLNKVHSTYLEFPFKLRGGALKWWGQNATLIYENNEIAGFSVIARDITERKQMEINLKENEERLRLITQTANDAIITMDNEFNIIQWNSAAERMYGFTEAEIKGKSLEILMNDDDRETFNRRKSGADYSEENIDISKPFEKYGLKKDGTRFPAEITAAEWKNEGANYYTYVVRDISQRTETEKKIKLLASAIESTNEIISITDLNNKFIFVNRAFLSTYGYSEEEVIGQTPFLVSSDKNPPGTTLEIITSTVDGNWNGILYNRKKNGEEFLISLNTSCIYNSSGTGIALVGIARDITRDILAKEKLEESEERYRILFEHNPMPVIVSDYENNSILAVNKSAIQHYGYSGEEFLKLSICDIESAGYENKSINGYAIKIEDTRPGKLYKTHKKKGGLNISVEITTYNINFNNRIAVISIINDITSRIKVEKEIIKERDTAQRYLDISAVLMCVIDTDTNVVLINKMGCQILGYEEEEIIGRNWIQLCVQKEKREEVKAAIKDLMDGGNNSYEYFEYPVVTSSGDERILAFYNTAVYEENSEVSGILFSGEDITGRKKAERELEEYQEHLEKLVSERTEKLKEVNLRLFEEVKKLTEADEKIRDQIEFFKTLINTIPLPVFIRDRQSVYLDCNNSFENFVGMNREKIIGKSVFAIFPEDQAKIYSEMDEKILETLGEQYYETKTIDKHRNLHEVIIYQATLCKNDGSPEGTVGVMLDITPQKNLQKEIRKSLEREKDLSELKSRFISMASHEFRTPLTTILASADLLEILGPKWKEEKFRSHIAKIQNAVTYMTELIDDVLLVNRAETGRISFSPAKIDLYSLVNEVVENAKSSAHEKHNINVEYNSNNREYNLDKKLLTQIFSNLMSNAVKYSPAGGDIYFKICESELKIKLDISDNGIGISEEDQKHLFEPFQRGKNTGNIKGTGLGLSIVKKAVELHKGELFVKSNLNQGTTFTILLPLLDEV